MASDPTEEALKVKATEALEALALACGAKGHIFMVIKGDGGKIGGCSPSLRPYGAALMDEVEKATEKPVVVTSKREASGLLKAEKVLHTLAKTKHVELHPIVATMIQGLNEINNHKIPRVMALTDPSTMPKWFPFPPKIYAPRAQKMDLHQLFHVMDVIFGEVRGNLGAIQTLHVMLDRVYKTGNCSIGTRAGIDSFFEFLEDEAIAALSNGARAAGVKLEAADDVILTGGAVASETSGVAGGDDEDGELEGALTGHRSRKRTRAGVDTVTRNNPTPRASPVLSSANNGHVAFPPPLAADDDIDFERYISEEGGRDLAEFDNAFGPPWPTAQPFWDQHHSHVPAAGAEAPPSDMSEAFEVDVRIGEVATNGQRWEFGSCGELGQSGQSTLVTGSDPRLHSDTFQVASGYSIHNGNGNGSGYPQSTPTSNWTPSWFASEEGGAYQAQKQVPPFLGNDESVVRARLQQQMLLAEQLGPGEGGQNRGVAHPPRGRPLSRNDGLSDSMRRDFLPAAAPMTHNDGYDFARPGMEPRIRPVGLAMARAPSFSPVQTCSLPAGADAPGAGAAAAAAAQPSAPKPAGFLAKARGRMAPKPAAAGGPPKALKARSAEVSPKSSPPAIPQRCFVPGEEFEPLATSRSGEQPRFVPPNERRTHSGPQEAVMWTQQESSVTRQTSDPLRGVGAHSGKALKVLGLEGHGSFGSDGSNAQWSGSQTGSGSLDDGSETGASKKGISGLFSRLGRSKNKEEGRSGKSTGGTRSLGNQKQDPMNQPGTAVPAAPFQPGVYRADAWQGYVSTGGVLAGGMLPKQMSGPGVVSGGGGSLSATQGSIPPVSGGGIPSSRQGINGLPVSQGSIPPVSGGDDLYPQQGAGSLSAAPGSFPPVSGVGLSSPRQGVSGLPVAQGSIPPEDCEAFPLHRDVQHFDSFKSDGFLLAGDLEPEPEECESFPFQRPVSPPSDGIQRLMQRLSVTEGPVHTAPKQALGDSVKSPQLGERSGDRFENGLSPASVLKEEQFVGAYPPLMARGSTDGVAYRVEAAAYEDDEDDDDSPRSPGFALGIGTGDEIDFDDDSHLAQGAHVTSAGPEPVAGANGVPAQVVSVKVVNETTGVHALPAIPVLNAATGPSGGTGLTGVVPAGAVAEASEGAFEERDDVFDRLQRLRVGAPA